MILPRARVAATALLALLAAGCEMPGRDLGTIGISVPYEVETLDPHVRNALTHLTIAGHFYESLVTTDDDMRIGPGLARLWENPDPSTWVFHLRPGVRFHSGRPLRAPATWVSTTAATIPTRSWTA